MKPKVYWAMRIAAVLILSVWLFGAPFTQIEARFNKVSNKGPYNVSKPAAALHESLFVADLHSDSLLFGRDLNKRSNVGHVDFVRMREGRVALQMFTMVTKVPKNFNIERTSGDSDQITQLAVANRWPPKTWKSILERALYQGERLATMAAASEGKVVFVRNRQDLEKALAARSQGKDVAAVLLGIEGAHALEGKVENLDRVYEGGVRMIGLAHFFDNEFAGSAHGMNKGGVTKEGESLIKRMEDKRVVVDLSHSSAKTINDVLAMSTRPVVVSHTGVRGTCNNQRNLSDAQLRNIASRGGLIGIGFWSTAVCGTDAAAIARAIRHAANVAGVEHVALGSDFDGSVTVPFDASGMSLLTEALLKEGFSDSEIRKIMGENTVEFFRQNLP